jgi:hypothetical protein
MGGNVASNTPSRTVSLFESTSWVGPPPVVAAAGSRRLGEPAEPGSDRGEGAHKAARPQQLAPRPPTRAQKSIEPLLLHFVHVQRPVCRPSIERPVFDVLAEHPGSLLIAAAEQAAAVIMVRRRVALALMITLMRQG